MNAAKLTARNRVTIPMKIRQVLDLSPGDLVVYEVASDGTVVLKKADSIDADWLQAVESTLSEWNSKSDKEAYANL